MTLCGGVISGAAYDCLAPPVPGLSDRLVIANQNDINIVFDATPGNENVISDITMKTGTQAFAFDVFRRSGQPSVGFTASEFVAGFIHTVQLQVFDVSSDSKLNLESMKYGDLVCITESKNVPGNADSVFELFGAEVGLSMTDLTRELVSAETQGTYTLTLATPEDEGSEPRLPLSIWNTDYSTTRAIVDNLLNVAP